MGLLSRVANLQNNATTITSKHDRVERFFLDAKQLKPGVKYSSELFNLLCRDLVIKKGFLLTPDDKNITFIPESWLNLDTTTTDTMRIEITTLEAQSHNFNEIITSTDNCLKVYKQYFSIHEFSELTSLLLVPFYLKGTLRAMLLIVDPNNEIVEIAREISSKSETLMNKLLNSRKISSDIAKDGKKKFDSNMAIILQNFIDNNILEDTTLLIAKLQVRKFKNALIKRIPNIDSFVISKKIKNSIEKLITNYGKLIQLSSDQYLLFYKMKADTTPSLILHQINIVISSLFDLSVGLPKIDGIIKIVSTFENNSATSILEGVI